MNAGTATDDRTGFCQNCGRPLDAQTMRVVGSAVFCEPCLEARLNGRAPAGSVPPQSPPYAHVYGATGYGAGPTTGMPGMPPRTSAPNPGLAALLGVIPGVGAMYNEQYAKGIVHLMVFAVLVSLTNASGIFSLFVMGWIFYMSIEAHHTARARRDGTPLPNPFGLNDLSERLGFGKAWPAAAPPVPPPPPYTAASQPAPPPPSSAAASDWTAAPQPTPAADYAAPGPSPVYGFTQTPNQTPPPPPLYAETFQPIPPIPPTGFEPAATGKGFPAGALWLIGLGSFFFLATTGLFHGIPVHALAGFALIGLAVWLFLRRLLLETRAPGTGLTDSKADLPLRIVRALRASSWLFLIGLLLLLAEFGILGWSRSWPLLLILGGVLALAERLAHDRAATQVQP